MPPFSGQIRWSNKPCHLMPVCFAALLTMSVMAASSAHAQGAKVKVGTLVCKGQGGIGLIVGSKERLMCTYSPSGKGGKRELYGTITRIGLDIGIKGKSTIIWTVLSSTTMLPDDALRGSFVGASADVALGIGGGANVLVGGNNKSVVLQPLSIKGQTGINLAVGVSGLTLSSSR
jgi:Protein of unknown function (DUF992)